MKQKLTIQNVLQNKFLEETEDSDAIKTRDNSIKLNKLIEKKTK